MKKTLIITLTVLASFSVAGAATLDLTGSAIPSSITFAGDSTDTVILDATVNVDGSTLTLQDSTTVTTNGNIFGIQGSNWSTVFGVLKGATIDFKENGKFMVAQGLALQEQNLIFTGVLDTVVWTTDASLAGTTEIVSRTLLESSGDIWYREEGHTTNPYSVSFLAKDGSELEKIEANPSEISLGQYATTYEASKIGVTYVREYKLVPEPTTASLSLLGLAALMMRRRRG